MTQAVTAESPRSLLAIDPQKLLFSLSSFIAAAVTLGIAFVAALPRPWWALLTVYVTAQPMAGAFRPKIFYRLGGILTGAIVTIALVPNLQNSPELLVLCMAAWTGFCIYLAVLDRTPRAFLFQMAAFSSAVISFPYLDDPANIFTTTISRVEEMTVAIVCVTIAHAVIQPWSAIPIIRGKAVAFLSHASHWTAEALGTRHTRLEYEHRRRLAADVTELGMIAIHLPFDQRSAPATGRLVSSIQEKLANLLPLASAAANRLDLLRASGPLDPRIQSLVDDISDWLAQPIDVSVEAERALIARCRSLAPDTDAASDWRSLLTASLCARLAEFIETHHEARALVMRIGNTQGEPVEIATAARKAFPLARDHGVAALAGLATATAVSLYCTVWIMLAWPNGSATAAFAALITCSFATQDDPAPVIARYLKATLLTFPLAALYLFVILPWVDGWAVLVLMLAPAFLAMGYLQADPQRGPLALPMFSCLIVALGFLDRFQADFAVFVNTGLAQVGGIIAAIAVTRLFRSANVRWTAQRIIHENWADLAQLANLRSGFRPDLWTAQAVDRLGQIAARMAVASPADSLHSADGLIDLRIGRNVIAVRQAIPLASPTLRRALWRVLLQVSSIYRERLRTGEPRPAPASLRASLDRAIQLNLASAPASPLFPALLALVALRCNLLPQAEPYLAR
jgi:uncharacterized membrane protein YccC